MKTRKNKIIRYLLIGMGLLVALVAAGIFYVHTISYEPTAQATEAAKSAEKEHGTLVFQGEKDRPAIIFYQGALVDNTSYSLWAKTVSEAGYPVYLVEEPLNLAVMSPNKAEKIIKAYDLDSYAIGGHSLGGVMASRFAANHHTDSGLKGVFFLASYPDKKGSLTNFEGQVLSLTGTKDGVLNWDAYNDASQYLPQQTVKKEITGGNHAGFGSYGQQKGDNEATINNDEQQEEVASAMIDWLKTIKD